MLSESSGADRPQNEPPRPAHIREPERPPLHPDMLARAGTILGLFMIITAWVWVNVIQQGDIDQALRPDDLGWLLPGLGIGALFAFVFWNLSQRIEGIRQIVVLLTRSLDLNAMRFYHVVLFSFVAAVPEELLFRGAMQAQWGLLLTAVIFGALHALSLWYFAYATCAGLLLGVLYILGGTLWLPIGAHFAIDFVAFMLLVQRRNHIIA